MSGLRLCKSVNYSVFWTIFPRNMDRDFSVMCWTKIVQVQYTGKYQSFKMWYYILRDLYGLSEFGNNNKNPIENVKTMSM